MRCIWARLAGGFGAGQELKPWLRSFSGRAAGPVEWANDGSRVGLSEDAAMGCFEKRPRLLTVSVACPPALDPRSDTPQSAAGAMLLSAMPMCWHSFHSELVRRLRPTPASHPPNFAGADRPAFALDAPEEGPRREDQGSFFPPICV